MTKKNKVYVFYYDGFDTEEALPPILFPSAEAAITAVVMKQNPYWTAEGLEWRHDPRGRRSGWDRVEYWYWYKNHQTGFESLKTLTPTKGDWLEDNPELYAFLHPHLPNHGENQ